MKKFQITLKKQAISVIGHIGTPFKRIKTSINAFAKDTFPDISDMQYSENFQKHWEEWIIILEQHVHPNTFDTLKEIIEILSTFK